MRPSEKNILRDEGQSIVEYAMTLGIIVVLAVGILLVLEQNALQVLSQIEKAID